MHIPLVPPPPFLFDRFTDISGTHHVVALMIGGLAFCFGSFLLLCSALSCTATPGESNPLRYRLQARVGLILYLVSAAGFALGGYVIALAGVGLVGFLIYAIIRGIFVAFRPIPLRNGDGQIQHT